MFERRTSREPDRDSETQNRQNQSLLGEDPIFQTEPPIRTHDILDDGDPFTTLGALATEMRGVGVQLVEPDAQRQ
jgi:hypothetical protein